ncbi:Uncharacterized protein TCM_021976 [Theobroma cacao]|uniref:Uncharacterized protein n=1 Tax=Theobroma cacao TaxID=3641 RepID=A0A061ERB3_THECC|nr:Uncharacterized protein TCM_021976 [Theobroma cacao]
MESRQSEITKDHVPSSPRPSKQIRHVVSRSNSKLNLPLLKFIGQGKQYAAHDFSTSTELYHDIRSTLRQ